MFKKVKYIRTSEDRIIVFSDLQNHNEFLDFRPKTAGFISFGLNNKGQLICACYGRSSTLQLDSNPEEDSILALRQILDYDLSTAELLYNSKV